MAVVVPGSCGDSFTMSLRNAYGEHLSWLADYEIAHPDSGMNATG